MHPFSMNREEGERNLAEEDGVEIEVYDGGMVSCGGNSTFYFHFLL